MTTSCFDREDETFIVLINHEEQYSIWPHWKKVPGGWSVVEGIKGDKKKVCDYVDQVWTDMRPKSLRVWMEEQEALKKAGNGGGTAGADAAGADTAGAGTAGADAAGADTAGAGTAGADTEVADAAGIAGIDTGVDKAAGVDPAATSAQSAATRGTEVEDAVIVNGGGQPGSHKSGDAAAGATH